MRIRKGSERRPLTEFVKVLRLKLSRNDETELIRYANSFECAGGDNA